MEKIRPTRFVITLFLALCGLLARAGETLPLNGIWQFSFDDPQQNGLSIYLPGTMDQAGYGKDSPEPALNNQWTFGWRRPKVYEGKAWYSRTVKIPESWSGKHIVLFLEQTRSTSVVFVDGREAGGVEESLVTPHRHDLSGVLSPGEHTLTILLDNSEKHGIGGSYTRSSMGQGNWQGVTGRIELRQTDPLWIDHTVFTPQDKSRARVEAVLGSDGIKGVRVEARILDGSRVLKTAKAAGTKVDVDIDGLQLWDEFRPKIYTLQTVVTTGKLSDTKEENIGIRFVSTNDRRQFTVNGRPIFLRGTVNYNIFPLTGYPATDVEEWIRIFCVYKEWGMNHVRFHSLTPPEAALEAADRLGIYLQCEAPKAGRCGKPEEDAFQIAEGRRLIREYGNHPSWILMSMGNELAGEIADIQHVLDAVREGDSRRLYTSTTGNSKQELQDDYKIYGGIVRGFKGPFTDWDYREVAEKIGCTMLSHEVGQWHVYPDIRQIEKYTGVMGCDNLVLIREDLRKKGLLEAAEDFTQTSGKVSALLYKEEMEAIERTPDYGGFQLLTLDDFPAQGTASSGMIDIFHDPKGYLDAATFREYCAPVVPLLRLPKRTFLSSEKFHAQMDLFCYLPEDMTEVVVDWELKDSTGTYISGNIPYGTVKTGNVHPMGTVTFPLREIQKPTALEFVASVRGTSFRNRWKVWVYPDVGIAPVPEGVCLARDWRDAREHLSRGEKVLFFPSTDELAKWRPGQFKTVFWSPVWLKRGPETMSIAARTDSPALEGFPTERHTDWQWFSILEHAISVCIDDLPPTFTPIVGVIDSFRKNERLADIFEARVGDGALLFVTLDLMKNLEGDVARIALRNSLFNYAASDRFNPVTRLEGTELDKLFRKGISRNAEKPQGNFSIDISADGTNNLVKKGYNVSVKSKKQTSGDVCAWADKRDLDLTLTMPANVAGRVSLHMRNSKSSRWGMLKTPQEIAEVDWVEETFENYGNKQPAACILVNGKDIGTISRFGPDGMWYSFDLDRQQTSGGKVDVSISTFNFPNILCELTFLPLP